MSKLSEKIEKANEEALKRLKSAKPKLVDICRIHEQVEGMHKKMILHAGPPVKWEDMCGPMKGAITGALVYEKVAENLQEAEKMAAGGEIEFSPCHEHGGVGPMTGVASYSMWAFKVKNEDFGNYAFCTLNEGLGKVLRFGANDDSVIEKLRWMEEVLGPGLKKAIALSDGGIDIKMLTANALHMGDECHNRNVAATSLLLKELVPLFLKSDLDKEEVAEIYKFIAENAHFYLNLSMATCKVMTDTIAGIEYSTIMTLMARNGTELGIKVAGLGNKWFTAPAGVPKGLYFPGYTEEDANLDLGDSTISEAAGIGGFAMASAPAIVRFVGGSYSDALKYTNEMGEICAGRHTDYTMPTMNFLGTPLGVDLRKVIETGITPIINTGIAHKEPGIGQVGAGILYAPLSCFEEAFEEFNKKYNE